MKFTFHLYTSNFIIQLVSAVFYTPCSISIAVLILLVSINMFIVLDFGFSLFSYLSTSS